VTDIPDREEGRRQGRLPSGRDEGTTLIELLVALVLVVALAGLAMPATAASIDSSRARQAAEFVAARLRFAKQQSVFRSASMGLVFDRAGDRWTFQVCADGNANGLRRAELAHGPDRCVEGPYDLEVMFPGVKVAVDGTIRGPDGEAGSSDAVRFGRSDLASFSPSGGCTAGSLFVRSAKGAQFVIRVGGVTGRTRVLRYDSAARIWRDS
jgi:type II secretory pathway pseudopilin PulG